MKQYAQKLTDFINHWLTRDGPPPATPLCDFNRLRFEIRPGDVILVEGRSRVAEVIKIITQSPWSHAALYIGRLFDVRSPALRARLEAEYEGDPGDQLILEALLGEGTVINPLSKYQHDHMRICRPDGLSAEDAQTVLSYAIKRLGNEYDLRQILDLARFIFPWSFLPRRWRSSLFQHNAGTPTRTVCSTLLAEAFSEVDFPILPFIDRSEDGSLRLFKRNPKLFAPRDFDYSPYFHIIKYPFIGLNDIGLYRRLPWSKEVDYFNEQPDQQQLEAVAAISNPQQPDDERISDPDSAAHGR